MKLFFNFLIASLSFLILTGCSYVSTENYLLPPKSNIIKPFLLNKNKLLLEDRYKYVKLYLGEESEDYHDMVNSLNQKIKHFSQNNQLNPLCKNKQCSQRLPITININGIEVARYIVSDNKRIVFLEIDYKALGVEKALKEQNATQNSQVTKNFHRLAFKLLKEFSALETTEGYNVLHEKKKERYKYKWPHTISQVLVEKIWEVIPFPHSASLARYGSYHEKGKYFLLLNPQININVDLAEKNNKRLWSYKFKNTTSIKLFRDSEGYFIRNTIYNPDKKHLPSNSIDGKKSIHLASTQDIELSNKLIDIPYLFLYQDAIIKRNNKSKGSISNCSLEDNDIACTSALGHFKSLTNSFENYNLNIDSADYLSSFGKRSLFIPTIGIFIDNQLYQIPINTLLNQVIQGYSLSYNIEVSRLYNGKYKQVILNSYKNFILLPGDRIFTK